MQEPLSYTRDEIDQALAALRGEAPHVAEPPPGSTLAVMTLEGPRVVSADSLGGIAPEQVRLLFAGGYLPMPFPLRYGDYQMGPFPAGTPPGSYPPAARIVRGDAGQQDPTLEEEPTVDYTGPYNANTGTRVVGQGVDGISFLNLGADGNLGALVISLDTRGIEAARLYCIVGTITAGGRPYRITLQGRVGPAGAWESFRTYDSRPQGGSSEALTLNLPASYLGQELVQFRWRYHAHGTGSGARPQLHVGQIRVTVGSG